jgi:hypothetical protein
MTNQLFMLSRFIELYCHRSPTPDNFYDFSYGEISIHITDEGYEYSDDNDTSETRYPLDSVSQLRDLIDNQA